MGNKGATPTIIDIESMERALDKITDSNQGSDMMGRGANFDINNDDNFSEMDFTHTKGYSDTDTPEEQARPEYIDPVVAEKEQRAVFWFRTVVVTVLVVAVAILASTMYVLISKNEKEDFETQVCCIGWMFRSINDVVIVIIIPLYANPCGI